MGDLFSTWQPLPDRIQFSIHHPTIQNVAAVGRSIPRSQQLIVSILFLSPHNLKEAKIIEATAQQWHCQGSFLSLRYFAGNSAGITCTKHRERLLPEVRRRCHFFYRGFFLQPRAWKKTPPSARPRRLLPKHQSASKSGVWRQWLSWWSRRVFQARALVARPGAQLARGAAAVPVYACAAVSRS